MATPRETTPLPLRESTDIQGDILAGFRKDHARLLFLTFGDQWHARAWLDQLRTRIASTQDVTAFNADFSSARRRLNGRDPDELNAVWRSISFTYPGLAMLIGGPPLADVPCGSTQEAFAQGSACRAELLGDTGRSDPACWLFGGTNNEPVHAVLTVAADREDQLRQTLADERRELACHLVRIVFEQAGATLQDEHSGREHFGFRDSISQPGVRGYDPPDPERPDQVKDRPGMRIIAPGEFVVGMPTDHRMPAWLPSWMNGGSFQVIRRLAQDVPGWWRQVEEHLAVLKQEGAAPEDATADWVAARLVGRWPSGAPLAKSPHEDPHPDPDPDSPADNDISYRDDLDGRTTPLFCHLRKTNPRDGLLPRPTDSAPLPEEGALDGRRLMRRSIPFGEPYEPRSAAPGRGGHDPRGLVFVCYQSDLTAQFEFVQRRWVDNENFPQRDVPPGRDTAIGQCSTIAFPAEKLGPEATVPLTMQRHVHTEGAVYAFTPSLSALKALAAGEIPVCGDPPTDRVLRAPVRLRQGEVVSSGRARLRFAEPSELTVHDENEALLWRSDTASLGGAYAEFRADGELAVVNTNGGTVWATPTVGNPGATLVVGADGNVAIRSARGDTLWQTGTAH